MIIPRSPRVRTLRNRTFKIPSLGFVRVIDYIGGDQAIVDAARVSYRGGKTSRDTRGLLRYLMRHDHSSPFEFASIVLHIKAPLFVARQWYRHRTAKVNEISGRYVELPHEHYTPPNLYLRPTVNKQGRSNELPEEHGALRSKMLKAMQGSAATYKELLKANVAPELARIALPMGTYTEWYWKMDLRNLLHFLRLRLHHTAQHEITAYARCIGYEIVKHWAPITWEAFEDYQLNGLYFSAPAYRCLIAHLSGHPLTQESSRLSKGEWREFEELLERAGRLACNE